MPPSRDPILAKSVAVLPIPKSGPHIFHRVGIEGVTFTGTAWQDLFICGERYGEVALGVCSIVHFDSDKEPLHGRAHAGEWWICKYTNEERINISMLSEHGRAALSAEFGIGIGPEAGDDFGAGFYCSPAFMALTQWVRKHPKLAKRFGSRASQYVGGWYDNAVNWIDHAMPPTLR